MYRIILFCLLVEYVYASTIFKVHGGLQAGNDGGFTIQGEALETPVEYDLADVKGQIKKASIEIKDGVADKRKNVISKVRESKTSRGQGNSDSNQRRRLLSEVVQEDGFKYSNMMPRHPESTQLYVPSDNNTMVYDQETGEYITLSGWMYTKMVPIIEDVTYLSNAVKVLGALMGIDMRALESALIGEKETYILLERIKNGDIPIFIPGKMYVGEATEVGVDGASDAPQYCSAFRGNYSTATWIRKHLWNNITDTDNLESTKSADDTQRWDTVADIRTVQTLRTVEQDYTDYDAVDKIDYLGEITSEVCI